MQRLGNIVLCSIVLALCFTTPAAADSLAFTDLGLGGLFTPDNGYQVSGIHGGNAFYTGYVSIADLFTASVGGALSQIDLGLTNIGGANSAVVSLYTDVNGNVGTLLFSGTVHHQPPFPGSTTLTTLTGNSVILTAGANYFMVVAPGGDTTFDSWNTNGLTPKAQGTILANTGNGFDPTSGVTDVLSAFDVQVKPTSVPEPSFWLTLAAELFALLGAARLKILRS